MSKEKKEKRTSQEATRQANKKSKRSDKKTRSKKRKAKSKKGFAVWRAVSLLPRISWSTLLSSLLFLGASLYVFTVVRQAQQQLEINLTTTGVKRVYKAQKKVRLNIGKGQPPIEAIILDQREAPLWKELSTRFGNDIGAPPPLVTHADIEVNIGAWHTSLRTRGIDFIDSVGVGTAGDVSVLWAPKPAPVPVLIVGHYFDKIAWIDPKIGVILSEVPESWQTAPSIRLPPQLSRRW